MAAGLSCCTCIPTNDSIIVCRFKTSPNRALAQAISSASVVDLAVELCFFDEHNTGIERYRFSGGIQLLKCSWPCVGMKQNRNLYVQPALEIRWGRQSPGSCGQLLSARSWLIWAFACTMSNELLYLQVLALQNLRQVSPNETTKGITWALWRHDCAIHLHAQALLRTFETLEDMEPRPFSVSLLVLQRGCIKNLQSPLHMNSCHRSLKFLGRFFESYVLSGGYDSKGTPSFQSTAFRDGLATTFLIVDDHTTILLASLQGEYKDHRFFPFFQR